MAKETIVHCFWDRVEKTPEKPAIYYKASDAFQKVIWREHGRVVELTGGGLLNLGLAKGDKVAILAHSKPHWTWADVAILSCGGTTVPIYPTLGAPEVDFLLKHSEAIGVFVENERQLKRIVDKGLPPSLKFAVIFEGTPPASPSSEVRFLKWDDLLKDGEVFLLANKTAFPERRNTLEPSDIASIVYTSGTTGVPKGVVLSHKNIHFVCKSLSESIQFRPDDLSLSFLPLAHVYERVGGQFVAIFNGVPMAYAESIEQVPKNLVEIKPTILNGVPRFYEKAYQRIQNEIRHLPKPQQYLIRWALSLGRRALKLKESPKRSDQDLFNQIYRAELRIADRLVFSKIRKRFGGKLRLLVSGAAPLSEEVQTFFEIIGMTIVEGYGLTETSAPIACNHPDNNRKGTVGQPLPGIEVKLAEDGELMVRGPGVFASYYKNEDATNQALRDGWFYTGDIAEITSDGYIKIKDRKKDIIITAGGKHVAPQYIENLYRGEPLISHILVYGDRRKYITALITLNKDILRQFAESHNLAQKSDEELTADPQVRRAVEDIVNRKNEELASFERIKRFAILDHDFTVENDELTPTFKLKRKAVTEKHKALLDGLYDAEDLEAEEGFSRLDLKTG